MAELISLTDLPSISSSINHICTSSSAPLALTAAGIHAVLRRTKSMGYRDDIKENRKSIITYGKGQVDNEDENARGRPNSLVRANSRRRRSAASVHQMEIGGRSRSEVVRETTSLSSCRGSVELGSHYQRGVSCRSISQPRNQSRATSRQRSPPRGRALRRDVSLSSHEKRGSKRQHDKTSNTSRRQRPLRGRRVSSSEQTEDPFSSDAEDFRDIVLPCAKKGGFWEHNPQGPEEFRFPKCKSQQDSTWRAGDGFSSDEARPDFISLMSGKRKRKGPSSLSALGRLPVEAENIQNKAAGSTSSQPHPKLLRGSQAKIARREVTELWPTRESFTDDTIAERRKYIRPEHHSAIQPTSPLTLTPEYQITPKTTQVIPRKRQASDFENFGRHKRRSRSRHGEYLIPSSIKVPRQSEESPAGNDEDDEYGYDPYESMGEESEEQSTADEETEHIPATVYDSDNSDNGSEMLYEDDFSDDQDDFNEDMNCAKPDRTMNKEPLRSSGAGDDEQSVFGLSIIASRVQSLLGPGIAEKQATAEGHLCDGQG